MPLIICIPIYNTTRGFTCGVPSDRMLLFVSAIFGCLLLLIGLVNVVDNRDRLSLGSGLVALFVAGVASFLAVGLVAARRSSRALIAVAFWLWFLVYVAFFCLSIVSVTGRQTLEKTSVNGRCPMTLWLFDWCERVSRRNTTTTSPPDTSEPTTARSRRRYPESTPEYRARVFLYLGIFVWWMGAIKLFTLYGAVVYDIKHRLNWPPPIVTVEGSEEAERADEQRVPK